MITKTLNRAEAEELFEREAVCFGRNAVPEYKVMELFGKVAADFIDRTLVYKGYLEGGVDYNAMGACGPDTPLIHFYYLPGFLKIVQEHNYTLTVALHNASEGGAMSDRMWRERAEAISEKPTRKAGRQKKVDSQAQKTPETAD